MTDALDELLASGRLPDEFATLAADFAARAGNTADARSSLRDTLTTYLAYPAWRTEFEAALTSHDRFRAVSDTAAGLVAAGADPAHVRVWLNAFHLALMSQDRDEEDDVVLEVLDTLVGF